jgi:hypothetical protein
MNSSMARSLAGARSEIWNGLPNVAGTTNIDASGLYGGGGSLDGKQLILNVNGGGAITLDLVGATNAASQAALFAAIVATWPQIRMYRMPQHVTPIGNPVVALFVDTASNGSIIVGAGSANGPLGLTPGTFTPAAAARVVTVMIGGRPAAIAFVS